MRMAKLVMHGEIVNVFELFKMLRIRNCSNPQNFWFKFGRFLKIFILIWVRIKF